MATEYTENYDLDLYVGDDKPNLRDQYNAAMGKIDNALQGLHEGHSDNVEAIANLTGRQAATEAQVQTHGTQIQTLTTNLTAAESDIDHLQSTVNQQGSSISSLNTRMGTAEGNISRLQAKDNELQQAINNVIPKWTLVKSGTIDISGAVTIPSGQRKTIEYKVERWGSLYHLLLGNNQKFAISRAYGGTEVVEIPELQDIFPSNEFHQFWVTQLSTVNATNQACSVVFSNNSIVNNKFAVEIPAIGTPMPINTDYFWVK